MKVEVFSYFPLIDPPTRLGVTGAGEHFTLIQEDFLQNLPKFLINKDRDICQAEFCFRDPPKDYKNWVELENFLVGTKFCNFYGLRSEVWVDVENLKEVNNKSHISSELIGAVAGETVCSAIEGALLLSELAYPGVVVSGKGISLADQAANWIDDKKAFPYLFNPGEEDPTWPDLTNINLLEVLDWALNVGYGKEGFASSRVGKALAAFSNALGQGWTKDGEVLFRALQGLEAFYCDETGSLRNQLSEKTRKWIGDWEDRKNIVGKLYDFRSRFVHGVDKIEYKNYKGIVREEEEKLIGERAYSSSFSVRLLVGTLQKCIFEKVKDISWDYSYKVIR